MNATPPSEINLLVDIQKNTLYRVLAIVYLVMWFAMIFGNSVSDHVPRPLMMLAIGVMAVCGLSFWLSQRHLMLARYTLVLGLWLSIMVGTRTANYAVWYYLFLIVVLIASNLTNLLTQVLIAIGSSAFILLTPCPAEHVWGSILVTWTGLVTSYSTFQGLVQAFDTSYHYQEYAVEQMKRARDQRAELARLTQVLQTSQDSLQRLNIQLRHARNVAEEARQLKAQFAANVSHELRTPINLIVGFSELIATAPETYGVPLPSAYRADIQAIYRNAKHLQSLINDILDISQLEAAQLAIIKEDIDARVVIEEAIQIARSLIENKKLRFFVDVSPHLPVIRMDRVRIRQVILNLLANAARFTDAGSVTLRAACDEKHLTISVIDTGLGISSDKQDRVFEEFYQIERQLSATKGGTGLGLALSRQFVSLHQGRIWVESEGIPGKGSTFSFTLPLADTSSYFAVPTSGPSPKEETKQVRHSIIWDEDPAIIQLFRGYIRKHPVAEARSLAEAVQQISTLRPLAVICDQNTDTAQLEEHLLTVSPEITLIKCPMPSSKRVIQALGLADYLVKPISRQALLNALKRLEPPVRTILVIDDDRDILRMISRFLQTSSAEYNVQLASSGLNGLQCMRQDKPDVVITDIMMPDLDGLMLMQQMKADTGSEKYSCDSRVRARNGGYDSAPCSRQYHSHQTGRFSAY